MVQSMTSTWRPPLRPTPTPYETFMKPNHRRNRLGVTAWLLSGLLALLGTPASAQGPAPEHEERPTVVVNITGGMDALHASSMAIGLATDAVKSGRRSVIFLNVSAPLLAKADLAADVQFADFPPVKEMLANFLAAGGELYVCGHCASVTGVDHSGLVKGAVVVGHGDLFKKLPAAALTFSY